MSPTERLFAVRGELYEIRDARSDANDYARGYATGQIALAITAITTAAFILDSEESKRLAERLAAAAEAKATQEPHADGA